MRTEPYDTTERVTDPYQTFGANRQVYHSARKFIATVHYNWDGTNYPFDRHVLLVEMEDPTHTVDKLVFLPDALNTRLRQNLAVDGWKINNVDFTTRKNYYDTNFGDPMHVANASAFSHLTLAISIEREDRMTFWKLTIGVYGAMVVVILAFFFDSSQPSLMSPRSSMVVGSLFAAIVNMRASEGVLGHTDGLTLVDQIHIISIVYIFLSALALITSRLLYEAGYIQFALTLDRRILCPLALSSFLIWNIALIWYALYIG